MTKRLIGLLVSTITAVAMMLAGQAPKPVTVTVVAYERDDHTWHVDTKEFTAMLIEAGATATCPGECLELNGIEFHLDWG